MALKDFFRISKLDAGDNSIYRAATELNKDHAVYAGHFPGNPVVPGVCLVHMLKELVSQILKKPVILCEAGSIKFLHVINPSVHPEILWDIRLSETESGTEVRCTAFSDDKICFKFSGRFR